MNFEDMVEKAIYQSANPYHPAIETVFFFFLKDRYCNNRKREGSLVLMHNQSEPWGRPPHVK
jgi:hypothetical protein